MSPRSQRKRVKVSRETIRAIQAAGREGAKAPSLRARLENIEHFLAIRSNVVEGSGPVLKNGGLSPTASIPPIKSRIEGVLGYAVQLNSRLDALSHNLFADGVPGTTAETPQPYAIPDQLSLLEDLLRRALDRVGSITDRF